MSIRSIRKEMGITQRELADYLGVHPTLVTLCERSYRKMPYKVSMKWYHLKSCLEDKAALDQVTATVEQQAQDKVPQFLAAQVSRYLRKIPLMQHKLENMQLQYAQAVRTLSTVAMLRKQPDLELGSADDSWLNSVEARASKMSMACSPSRQALLVLNMQALAFMEQQVAEAQP